MKYFLTGLATFAVVAPSAFAVLWFAGWLIDRGRTDHAEGR